MTSAPARAQRILVTDAQTRAALAAVRSLGRAGHVIHTTSPRRGELASASRFVEAEHVLPDAEHAPAAWASALEQVCARQAIDWILPITELALGALYATGVDQRWRCLAPSREAYAAATDKYAILDVARRVGIRTPRSAFYAAPLDLTALPAGFEFPIVLKARRSRFATASGFATGSVALVRDADALAVELRDPGFAGGCLVQEFIPGTGRGVFLLIRAGECLAAFAHQRLREKPPSGGVSVLCESAEPDPRLLERSRALLEAIGFEGVAMVEYRGRAGEDPALMEINPRFWGSLALALEAGVDFPELLLRMHSGQAVARPAIREGVRSRWLLGDLDHLLIALRRPGMREATGRSAGRVVRDFLASFCDGSRNEVLRFDDWRPGLRELRLRILP